MITPAEPQRCNAPEQHLYPAHYRHRFSNYAMCEDYVSPYAPMDAPFEVELEVYPENDLGDKH